MSNIREILAQKSIEVIGLSDAGDKINGFDKWNSEQLFTFLINSQLNRYLFNTIIRIGTLDIENWPFNLEILSPQKIKEKVKESFIKKLTCSGCGQVLYNESYVDLIKLNEAEEIECPKCKLRLKVNYEGLENSFDISKRILSEFMEQLSSRELIKSQFVKHCLTCRNKKVIENADIDKIDNKAIRCEKCNKYCNLGKDYSVTDPFLLNCIIKKGGEWFEWYVYKLCSYMHQEVEHNLLVKVGKDGKQMELDVVGRDGDKLIIYECKDTQKESGWKDFESIPDLIENFENVTLVNSYDSNRKDLKKLLEPYKKEISIIKGSDLEDNFIGVGPTLVRLKSSEWPYSNNGVNSFKKLPQNRKIEIINILLSDISKEKELLESLSAFLKILEADYSLKSLLLKKEKKIMTDILKGFSEKIKLVNTGKLKLEKELTEQIIKFFKDSLSEIEKEDLLKVLNQKDYFNLFLPSLEGKFGIDASNATNEYYVKLFRIFEGLEKSLSKVEIANFYEIFALTLKKFPHWSRQQDTLLTLYKILPYLDENKVKDLIKLLKENISTYSWSVNGMLTEICKEIFKQADDIQKEEIKSILTSISQVKEKTSAYEANVALTLLFPVK